MSRLLFLLFVAAAAGVAGLLFQVKYEVQDLERELAGVNRQILADQEAVHVLQAEWSYLNQPARIAELSRRHLGLGPMQPEQVAGIAALPPRPEDFGYAQAALETAEPEPRRRPATPVGWEPRRLQPAPAQQAPVRQAPGQPTGPTRQATAPAPAVEEEVTGLAVAAEAPLNPVTGRPLPVAASLSEGQR